MNARSILAAVVVLTAMPAASADEAEPLKVLFLGDRGHHRPSSRASQLIPVMASRGIEVEYTEDVDCLSPETLGKYDALLLYANIEAITEAQESALLDYVDDGGGFVPIHCASYCFLNSPAYVELVGAQFLRHGSGEFKTRDVDPSHPILDGLEPFRTWDETYVHHRIGEDLRVLQVRPDGDGDEPWTWVRTQGDGRVFYTAYGHDDRTWSEPGFQDLIERGIRWASAEGEVFDRRPRVPSDAGPLVSMEAPSPIPNYLPDRKWGTQGEPIDRMQSPMEPAESSRHLALPDRFHAELFASEPEIHRPICMNWDHRGRLWIVESVDYPNRKDDDGRGRDRITICEDTDGDGRADRFTVFAEGLNIPTSLAFANGGVIVHQAPETLLLKDTDGDDRADVREVLLTGWGTFDTHAGPSNLRYGLDNWIIGIVGYSGFEGTVVDEDHRFSQGFYRFRADGSALEFLRSTSNNSWGVGQSEEGLIFGSTANGCPSVFLSIPNRYYEAVRGWSPRVLENIADSNRFFPVTDQVRQVDWHGGFTAAAGHALYTARTYPEHYWNSTAFVAEPTGHLAATFTLERLGTDFAAHYGWNLLASDDEWTAPIAAEVGPDGNVWIIDWYNYIVQHNPTPQGFETGKGNAYVTPLRDKVHGRIYRIIPDGAPEPDWRMALPPDDLEALGRALGHPNQFWRLHAQRLLVERGELDVLPELVARLKDRSVDAIGLNPGAIHALWTLHGLGALRDPSPEVAEAVRSCLSHPSAGVRRNAALVLDQDDDAADAILGAKLIEDPDPHVRMAALLTLSDRPRIGRGRLGNRRRPGLRTLRRRPMAPPTRPPPPPPPTAEPFLKALAGARFDHPPGAVAIVVAERVAEHYARGGPGEGVVGVLEALASGSPEVAAAVVAGLARGTTDGEPIRLGDDADRALSRLLEALPDEGKGRLIGLADRWGVDGFAAKADEVAAALLNNASDEALPEAARIEAARQYITLRRDDDGAAADLLELISPRTDPALASGLIAAIGRSTSSATGSSLVAVYPSLTPAIRPDVLRVLLVRSEWTNALMDGIEGGQIPLSQLALDQTQALSDHPDASIADRAQRLLNDGGGLPDPDRQQVIDTLSPKVLEGGDPTAGKVVFEQLCAKCHLHDGEGGRVGPDLSGMAAQPREELLIHILDPSRSVEGNYTQYTVATVDGRILAGLLASETKTSMELIDAEGESHAILREEIDELIALQEIADARRVRGAGHARAIDRPAGLPRQDGQVLADRSPGGRHGGQHARDIL